MFLRMQNDSFKIMCLILTLYQYHQCKWGVSNKDRPDTDIVGPGRHSTKLLMPTVDPQSL